jgi:hypothetical protein
LRNATLGNLKTSFSGKFHVLSINNYASRHIGGSCFPFNHRYSMAAMTNLNGNVVCCCMPCTEWDLGVVKG